MEVVQETLGTIDVIQKPDNTISPDGPKVEPNSTLLWNKPKQDVNV